MFNSIQKTADLLGVSRSTVFRLINAGELKRTHLSARRVGISSADLAAYLKRVNGQ